jgi:hypothetical protein
MAIDIPNVEVDAEAGGRAPQPYFYAAHILARFEFEVANVSHFDSAYEFIIFLLLFPHRAR